jgi:hypothetical protein
MSNQAIIELYKIAEQADVRIVMDVGENRVVNKLKYLDGSETVLNIDIETFEPKSLLLSKESKVVKQEIMIKEPSEN